MRSSFLLSSPQSLLFQRTLVYYFFVLFFLFNLLCTAHVFSSKISYSDHCSSAVPESRVIGRVQNGFPFLNTGKSYYTGGESILGKRSSVQRFSDYSISFYTENAYRTETTGIYKVQAYLSFRLPFLGNYSGSGKYYSGVGNSYRPRAFRRRRSLTFLLNGFWSELSRKVCMVGSASWQSGQGKFSELQAVFKLNYASKNSTIFTSLIKGTLESLSPSNDARYFEPITIVSFPSLSDYHYTLLGEGCLGGNDIPGSQFLSLPPKRTCSFLSGPSYFDLEYASDCKEPQNCSPFGSDTGYLPHSVSLFSDQCFEEEDKMRYIIEFSNSSNRWHYGSFDPKTTLIGEGSWQSERDQLCIVACRLLSPTNSLAAAYVGDCSIRLSLRFPAILTMRNSSMLGRIWTNKTANDPGYFKSVMFRSLSDDVWRLPGVKYEYTEVDRARDSCLVEKRLKKDGIKYPNGDSQDLRFDMSVEHSEKEIAWGRAVPIFVGNELYPGYPAVISDWGESSFSTISEGEDKLNSTSPMNISYKITFLNFRLKSTFSSLNLSVNPRGRLQINAEGFYDAETGSLCMVGCRELYSYAQNSTGKSLDCEMIVNFEFPPVNSTENGFIEGIIQSKRAKTDPLYFDQLKISSAAFYTVQAKRSTWRMDLEIIMVLVSNTLACIFVILQLFYVKKHPEKLPFISIVMLTILTLGHFIPLVLNFEALILSNRYQQNVILRARGSGWLEVNEVSVRLITMIAFLLLFRLLYLAWTSRLADGNENASWSAEKKTLFMSLPLYMLGGLITLFVHWKKNGNATQVVSSNFSDYSEGFAGQQQSSTLTYLRSYAGLIVDGFLFPQIILNMFQNSRESSLSRSFYIGTTLARLLPHAYDLYRTHNYIQQDFDGSYIYANHNADFYSIAWDVIIPCGCILFAVIICLQQRFGGRCVLPQKVRELQLYEKVPVENSE